MERLVERMKIAKVAAVPGVLSVRTRYELKSVTMIVSLHHVRQCIDTPILLITPIPYSLTMAQFVRRIQIVRDGVAVVRLV